MSLKTDAFVNTIRRTRANSYIQLHESSYRKIMKNAQFRIGFEDHVTVQLELPHTTFREMREDIIKFEEILDMMQAETKYYIALEEIHTHPYTMIETVV